MQGAAGRAGRPARRLGRHAGEWLGACTQPCPLSKLPQRCHARPPVLGFIFCCGTPEVSSIHVYTTEGAAPTCLMLRAPAKRVAGEPRPPPPHPPSSCPAAHPPEQNYVEYADAIVAYHRLALDAQGRARPSLSHGQGLEVRPARPASPGQCQSTAVPLQNPMQCGLPAALALPALAGSRSVRTTQFAPAC